MTSVMTKAQQNVLNDNDMNLAYQVINLFESQLNEKEQTSLVKRMLTIRYNHKTGNSFDSIKKLAQWQEKSKVADMPITFKESEIFYLASGLPHLETGNAPIDIFSLNCDNLTLHLHKRSLNRIVDNEHEIIQVMRKIETLKEHIAYLNEHTLFNTKFAKHYRRALVALRLALTDVAKQYNAQIEQAILERAEVRAAMDRFIPYIEQLYELQ